MCGDAAVEVGIGAEVVAGVVESDALDYLLAPISRVCGKPIPMPYAKALETATIPQVDDLETAIKELLNA